MLVLFAGIPITSSDFWQNEAECTENVLKHVFRSATEEEMPMFRERVECLREAGQVLYEVLNIPRLYMNERSSLTVTCRNTNAVSPIAYRLPIALQRL